MPCDLVKFAEMDAGFKSVLFQLIEMGSSEADRRLK
ncbi:hypothetical protein X749_30590 [Mesorhizobium sp. LNJC391B00]|nr:hypothetical protein X749_30590 [Mesorhizobium sp. LNJC391B00]